MSIATCHKKLAVGTESINVRSHISAALKHCKIVLEVDPENEEVLWLSKLLERQQEVEVSKEEAAKRLIEETALKGIQLSMPELVQVNVYTTQTFHRNCNNSLDTCSRMHPVTSAYFYLTKSSACLYCLSM